MKKAISLFTLFFLVVFAFGQGSPLSFLNSAPAIPKDLCGLDASKKFELTEKFRSYKEAIGKAGESQAVTANKKAANNSDSIKAVTLRNMGYSEADIQKLKNTKKMSQKEKMAMANKIMQQKTGMSVDEAKKVSGYSEAGKKAWEEGFSTEQMARIQADTAKSRKTENQDKKLSDLLQKKKALSDKLQAAESKHIDQLQKLENDSRNALIEMQDEIKQINKKEEDCEVKFKEIHHLQDAYCQLYTLRYLAILDEYKSLISKLFPDCNALQEVTMQVLEAQTGVAMEVTNPDQMAMEEVQGYAILLRDVFKYKQYDN